MPNPHACHPTSQPFTLFIGHNPLLDPDLPLDLTALSRTLSFLQHISSLLPPLNSPTLLTPLSTISLLNPTPPPLPTTVACITSLLPRLPTPTSLFEHILYPSFFDAVKTYITTCRTIVDALEDVEGRGMEDIGVRSGGVKELKAVLKRGEKMAGRWIAWADELVPGAPNKTDVVTEQEKDKLVLACAVMLRMLGAIVGESFRTATAFTCYTHLLHDMTRPHRRIKTIAHLPLMHKTLLHPYATSQILPDKNILSLLLSTASGGSTRAKELLRLYVLGLDVEVVERWGVEGGRELVECARRSAGEGGGVGRWVRALVRERERARRKMAEGELTDDDATISLSSSGEESE